MAGMSYAEILDQVERLAPADRDRLAAHLRLLKELQDPASVAELERRADEMDRGENEIPGAKLKEEVTRLRNAR